MSDAFDVPTEIADVTVVGPLPLPVTGTFTPSGTQDVNIVSTITIPVSGPLTDVQLRAVPVPISGTVAVSNFPATQPVSGTVTSLQGTSPWIVGGTVAATQSGTWNLNNISGTISLPTGAATEVTLLAAKLDLDKFTFASTRLLVDGSGTVQPVSGTVTANQGTSPWVVSGTVAATQSGAWTTGRTWSLASGTDSIAAIQSGAWSVAVNNFPATQAVTQSTSPWVVSGTVTANAGTNLNTSTLATSALQTNGGQKTQIVDSIGNVVGTTTQSLNVSVRSTALSTLANGAETSVTAVTVQVLASNVNRKQAIIQNTGTANVRIGITGVLSTTGLRLTPSAIAFIDSTQAIFAVRETATSSTVLAMEMT